MNKQLHQLAEVYYGQSPKEVFDCDGEIPVIGTGGAYATANQALFSGSSIVVPRKGSLGNPQLIDEPFWPVDTTYAVIPKPCVDATWLYYSLDHYDLTRLNEATGVPSISRDWLNKAWFHDPGPDTQHKIGTILRAIDANIKATDALIEKYQHIKAGMMHDLFTRGLDANGQLRPPRDEAPELYKQSPLGWIPYCWTVASIQQVCTLIVDCPHSTPILSDDRYFMIRTSEIEDGRLLYDRSPTVSESEYRKRNLRATPRPGDIVFTREAPVGENFVVSDDSPICLGQRLMLMRPNTSTCCSSFLSHQLYTEKVKQNLDRITGGTTNPHVNVSDVKRFLVVLPALDEQTAIEALLCSIEERSTMERLACSKLCRQKHGLMHDLLSGHVRVKVGNPADEPAHV